MSTNDRVQVTIRGFPLPIYQRSLEHGNELIREFALIALSQAAEDSPPLPARLIELVDTLTRDYAGVTDSADAQRDRALDARLESVDLVYLVPVAAAEASRQIAGLLDEADDYCRSGETLLTLATPPDVKRFRDWYFGEFVRQISGAEPLPWPDYGQPENTQPDRTESDRAGTKPDRR